MFTHTFIYGSDQGSLIFMKPMIAVAWLHQIDGVECYDISMPQAFPDVGEYPTSTACGTTWPTTRTRSTTAPSPASPRLRADTEARRRSPDPASSGDEPGVSRLDTEAQLEAQLEALDCSVSEGLHQHAFASSPASQCRGARGTSPEAHTPGRRRWSPAVAT